MILKIALFVVMCFFGIPIVFGCIEGTFELLYKYGWKAGQYYVMGIVFALLVTLAYFF